MNNQVVVSDYNAMDRVLREEGAYILNVAKAVKKAGCNVLLVQKSILRFVYFNWFCFSLELDFNRDCYLYRDAVSELALHFLDEMKIVAVKDIEREDIEFVCKVSHNSDSVLPSCTIGKYIYILYVIYIYIYLVPL